MRTLLLTLTTCLLVLPVQAKYSGGTGEPNDPYQIATAADLIAFGETPADYDKHFLLTADIDLDPNLPGRKVFDKAVIAPDKDPAKDGFQGTPFTGVFDGGGHAISHVRIVGRDYLGLFGQLGWGYPPGGEVRALRVVDVRITGSGNYVAGLAGINRGTTTHCSSSGIVSAIDSVGGLVGGNAGTVTGCYSAGAVRGRETVGGLVGGNSGPGCVTECYSASSVTGSESVGGLVGLNLAGKVTRCYSIGVVSGKNQAGGLVGTSRPFGRPQSPAVEIESFWDIQTSGQSTSAGGKGLPTNEMQTSSTFLCWGSYGPSWTIHEGQDYPRLAWENLPGQVIPGPTYGGGTGTAQDPYLILTAEQFNLVGIASGHWDKHFKLMAHVDLSGFDGKDGRPAFNVIAPGCERYTPSGEVFVGTPFTGLFEGNGHRVSHVTVKTDACGGLFGRLEGEVMNLAVVDVNITSSGGPVGGVVAWNVGTLVCCYSTGTVSGTYGVGGSVGWNDLGTVTQCYSACAVSGNSSVGGLIGRNRGVTSNSYNIGAASGVEDVGGLVGLNDGGTVTHCYATGAANGIEDVGGLVGGNASGGVLRSFWDVEASGQAKSGGGIGKTTAEMHDPNTFTAAGWDFVGQPDGPHDIWAEPTDGGYPILWWQLSPLPKLPAFSGGSGDANDPYLISTPTELNAIGYNPRLTVAHFELVNDINLGGIGFYVIGGELCPFTGCFNGNGRTVSHLTLKGEGYLGLFGALASGAEVKNLGVVGVDIVGSGDYVGGLVGQNHGDVIHCHSTGAVTGAACVGGLVGLNHGRVSRCCSTGTVSGSAGSSHAGGLVGSNEGAMTQCHSMGAVSAVDEVGGLTGYNAGTVIQSYSTAAVSGRWGVGGLTGWNRRTVTQCYSTGRVSGTGLPIYTGGLVGIHEYGAMLTACFWDVQTSGQVTSAGGTGKTTAQMRTAKTFLDAGWDFVGETANGMEDLWWILEGKDYPRLWWELGDAASP